MKVDEFAAARAAVLKVALELAPREGWTSLMLAHAAKAAGVSRSLLAAALPKGVAGIIAFWSGELDAAMAHELAGPEAEGLRIRERVAFAVRARISRLRPHKEAARRAFATVALPFYGTLGVRLAWATADAIWRALKDPSTDFNYYSKRAILAGVWTTTFARWLADDSEDEAATDEFLDRRIDNVMQIEKAKARLKEAGFDPGKPLGRLARLRFPARS